MKFISFAFLTVSFIFIFGNARISACVCNYPYGQKLTKEQELNWYRNKVQTVISGNIISEKPLTRGISRNACEDLGTRQNIKVDRFWGVPVPKQVFLIEGLSSCDARLSAGESYLIFVYKLEGNKIYTGYCSGTTKLNSATEYLKMLGEGSKPKVIKSQKRGIMRRARLKGVSKTSR